MPGDRRARLKQWLESGEARLHPLTFPQRELWETSAIPIGDAANHICCLIHIRGPLTPRDCEAAIRCVADHQEVLRTSFLPGKERPLQMLRAQSEVHLQFRDLAPAERHPDAIEELAAGIFRKPFDLVGGPLYRTTALRSAPDDLTLVFAIHHAIADGWSLGVFVHDLFAAYRQVVLGASKPLPPVPLPYTAWGAAERAFWQPAEIESRAAFWKVALAGSPRLWNSPGASGALCRSVSFVPAELAARAREVARRNGATLFSTLLTAFQLTLSQWTGGDDIVVGTPVANRSKQAVRETMGYCSGIVPLRARVNQRRPFSESLRATHELTVECFANAMPFVELMRALGEQAAPGYHPVFQVRFALQNHPIPDVALPNLSAKLRMRSTGTARFDLGCEITEQEAGLEVAWLYQPSLFSPSEITELDETFRTVLGGACGLSERRIGAIAPALS